MRKRREINAFSISFLDLLSGALGAVIILYVALPKTKDVPIHSENKEQVAKIEELKKELVTAYSQIEDLTKKVEDSAPSAAVPPIKSDFDIGFKFKGKKIVFLLDTSFSMVEEDRMGQVKAGLKMLLTSMPKDYQIDIVQFPFSERAPFRTLFGTLKTSLPDMKDEAYHFLYSLMPAGGTPTRDALLFVLKNYNEASDIVLLSDGAPTFHNSNKKDDINDILRVAREENLNKIQINTIGVGKDFLSDKESERYIFLSSLAKENGGFFVGF